MDFSQHHHPQSLGAPMLQKSNNHHMSFLTTHSGFNYRPLSEATEILDTDYEAEYSEDESPRRSVESFGNDSSTTLSTPDDLPTPVAFDSESFHLQLGRSKPVQGPSGPHLFRSSIDSSSSFGIKPEDHEWHHNLSMSPLGVEGVENPIWVPQQRRSSEPNRTPEVSRSASRTGSISQISPQQEVSAPGSFVRSWTPTKVAEWMYESGVEDNLVERFIQNDISGAVLLDLHIEDLKELDIHSFGKRHFLMNMIQNLRNLEFSSPPNVAIPRIEQQPPSPPVPQLSRSISSRGSEHKECDSRSPDSDRRSPPTTRRRARRNRVITEQDIISPGESVSIVAIEQLIPKPHSCSKGENCTKYQRRQRKLARIAKEFPKEFAQVIQESELPPRPATTDNTNNNSTINSNSNSNSNSLRPRSYTTSSLVGSSDVLGPAQMPDVQLNAENLNGVQPRDPQENVRQFLTFQHMHAPSTSNDDEPLQMFPPLSPPDGNPPIDHVASQLRTLPKLTIPGQPTADEQFSPHRTITPSMGGTKEVAPVTAIHYHDPNTVDQNVYRHGTPFSEMDVPTTALPVEPLARENSQSVPPNMRFGNLFLPPRDPIDRSSSARPDHRRRPSFPTLAPLDENAPLPPTGQASSNLDSTALAFPRSQPSTTPRLPAPSSHPVPFRDPYAPYSGWMKKRKTRLLRHEWQDAHFTLNGTILAMHKDEQEALRERRALESIDVDDYAVACSSVASNSKLTAMFKRSVLRKAANSSINGTDETAFAFSLVPSSKEAAEKKQLFTPSSKSHHFAVKTRDDRIDWMRELMLAKALKKGREAGNEVRINGNVM